MDASLKDLPRWDHAHADGWYIGTLGFVVPPREHVSNEHNWAAIYLEYSIGGTRVLVPHYYFYEYN